MAEHRPATEYLAFLATRLGERLREVAETGGGRQAVHEILDEIEDKLDSLPRSERDLILPHRKSQGHIKSRMALANAESQARALQQRVSVIEREYRKKRSTGENRVVLSGGIVRYRKQTYWAADLRGQEGKVVAVFPSADATGAVVCVTLDDEEVLATDTLLLSETQHGPT